MPRRFARTNVYGLRGNLYRAALQPVIPAPDIPKLGRATLCVQPCDVVAER